MPTTVYRNMTSKNGDQGTYTPMRSSRGMRNSIHVNPGSLALSQPAGDQIGCLSHSTDVYMRNVNANTINTEKTNCSTQQPFYRESQLDGGRASNFAQYANAQVNRKQMGGPYPSYANAQVQPPPPAGPFPGSYPSYANVQVRPPGPYPSYANARVQPPPPAYAEQYRRQRENFAPEKKKVIMGRMTEGNKHKEFFTNRCGAW